MLNTSPGECTEDAIAAWRIESDAVHVIDVHGGGNRDLITPGHAPADENEEDPIFSYRGTHHDVMREIQGIDLNFFVYLKLLSKEPTTEDTNALRADGTCGISKKCAWQKPEDACYLP